jgi:thiamine transporter ThiT
MKNLRLNVRQISLLGMLVALSVVLDTVFKFYQQANGGSINLAMVGLSLIALSLPPLQAWLGITIVFGLLTALLDGYLAYYFFDYLLALSGFVVISLVRNPILKSRNWRSYSLLAFSFLSASLWRLLMHVISGVLYFEVDWLGSLIYNLTYLVPSMFLSFSLVSLLYFSVLPKMIARFTSPKML